MSFSQAAWAQTDDAFETIRTMAFNNALADGSLSRDAFQHYIVQDAHYLIGFGRALALAAAKAPEPDRMVQFCDAAKEAVVVERALHESFFKDWGITGEAFAQTPVSPACHHYVSYLTATAFAEPYPIVLAALLPCFWIYAEVGRDIAGRASAQNPYQAWIDTYADEGFHEATRLMREATDAAAERASDHERAGMMQAYVAATQLEYMFWDSAYRQERWPL